jgi:hypothetical protein
VFRRFGSGNPVFPRCSNRKINLTHINSMLAWGEKLHHCSSRLYVPFHGGSTPMKPSRIFRLSGMPSNCGYKTIRSWLVHRPDRHHGASGKNERSIMLRKKILMVVLLSLMAGTLTAQEPEVTPLMSKDVESSSSRRMWSRPVQSRGLFSKVERPGEVQRMSAPAISGTLQHLSINR